MIKRTRTTGHKKTDIDAVSMYKHMDITEDMCLELLQRIENIIEDVCIECGYDKANIRATNWNYILYEISRRVFKIHPELIRCYNEKNQTYDKGVVIPDNVEMLYDAVYVPLCDKYNQIIGQYAFQKMLGLEYAVFNEWNRQGRVTTKGTNLYLKMIHDREKSLQSAMISSNTNPVKYLAIGNHEFAWNETKTLDTTERKPELTLNDLPELEDKELSDNYLLPFNDDSE